MKHRSHQKRTEANEIRTQAVVEKYRFKCALLDEWEAQPNDVQIANHDYLLELRKQIRIVKNCLLHRSDPNAKV